MVLTFPELDDGKQELRGTGQIVYLPSLPQDNFLARFSTRLPSLSLLPLEFCLARRHNEKMAGEAVAQDIV